MTRSSPSLSRILAALVAVLAFAVPAPCATTDFALSDEWREALEPLRGMPVQDTGFVRTTYTFSENLLSAVSGKRSLNGVDGFEVLFTLLSDPQQALSTKLVKVSHPDLVRIYGSSRISVNQWRDDKYRGKVMNLIQGDLEKWQKPLNSIEYQASLLEGLEEEFAIVPRAGEWLTPMAARRSSDAGPSDLLIVEQWSALRKALAADDAPAGGSAASELSRTVEMAAGQSGADIENLKMDLFYHSHEPFKKASLLYLFSALLYGAGVLLAKPKLNWAGYALLAGGFAEHMVGVVTRWIISERAPLSNMYESFTFAVAGMVLIALVLEAMRVVKLVGLGGAVLGFVFMVIAHKAPIFDSQIRPLMPALQSSWLTYHVVTIMLSYSAFALSFFVSILYLCKSLFLKGDAGTSFLAKRLPGLDAMDIFNYRIIGVGFPLLTLGIVFGAVWAATAWGRPWGFDPKETWSAITWLIYAIYLHVRYLKGWSGRRAAILSLVGFLGVLFTYLGVNYLLPGLHSYV